MRKAGRGAVALAVALEAVLAGSAVAQGHVRRMLTVEDGLVHSHVLSIGEEPREHDVLSGFAGGNTYQTLAKSLGLSADTVRFHIRNIYRKLHVHSQAEAVAKALRKGIL
jgi:DNA-binding NarL/FixJ family response regulator